MKQNYLSLIKILFIVIITTVYCTDKSKQKTVKITMTRAFHAKQEFDSLVVAEPAYALGYDNTMGMDFSWRTRHYDKFSNIIYIEAFDQEKNGKERVSLQTTQEYYSPSEQKLSLITEKWTSGGISTKEYIRNDQGQLLELREFSNDKLSKKAIFIYNEYKQCIKEEKYIENGLSESVSYYYDLPSHSYGKIVKTVSEVFGKEKTKTETTVERNKENQITRENYKYYNNLKLVTDLTTSYSGYKNNIPTLIITEGFNGFLNDSNKKPDGQRYKTEKSLNQYGDIIEFKYESFSYSNSKSNSLLDDIGIIKNYQLKYAYNDRNEWTNIVLSVYQFNKVDKYIITREIKYLD